MSSGYIIAVRTHYWDEGVKGIVQKLLQQTSARVVLYVDESNGPVDIPSNYEKLNHSVDTFVRMGFPATPSVERCLWFNGDYPLYDLVERAEFDHLIMIEADCAITGNIDDLVAQLRSNGIDYATVNTGPRKPPYPWHAAALNWFENKHGTTDIYGGMFPVVFISRKAVEALKKARLEMAQETKGDPDRWPHCEPFSATQLNVDGFEIASLALYCNTDMVSTQLPISLHEALDRPSETEGFRIFHPVLDGARYDAKERQTFRQMFRRQESMKKQMDKARKEIAALTEENKRLRKKINQRLPLYQRVKKKIKGVLSSMSNTSEDARTT